MDQEDSPSATALRLADEAAADFTRAGLVVEAATIARGPINDPTADKDDDRVDAYDAWVSHLFELRLGANPNPMRVGRTLDVIQGAVPASLVSIVVHGHDSGLADQRIEIVAAHLPPTGVDSEEDPARSAHVSLRRLRAQLAPLLEEQSRRVAERRRRGMAGATARDDIAHLDIDADSFAALAEIEGGEEQARARIRQQLDARTPNVKRSGTLVRLMLQLNPTVLGLQDQSAVDALMAAGPLISLTGGAPTPRRPVPMPADAAHRPMWTGDTVEIIMEPPEAVLAQMVGRPFSDIMDGTPAGHRRVVSAEVSQSVLQLGLEPNLRRIGP